MAAINLKEHRKNYDQFLKVVSAQLGFLQRDFERFDQVLDEIKRRNNEHFLIAIDNLEVLNEYTQNDTRYDAQFVSSLNFLKNTDNTLLLCVSQVWLKEVVFGGETSILELHKLDIPPLSEKEIQSEFSRKLDNTHPFLQNETEKSTARKETQNAAKPYPFLESLLTRLESFYQHESFKKILTHCKNDQK